MKLIKSASNHSHDYYHCSLESSLGREKQEAFFLQKDKKWDSFGARADKMQDLEAPW